MNQETLIIIFLSIIQGITEWLPISSSGHLVLAERLFNYDASLSFEILLHFGTLLAVCVYFFHDLKLIVRDFFLFRTKSPNFKLAILLIIATIPAAFFGLAFYEFFENSFTNAMIFTAFEFFITGILLLIASLNFTKNTRKEVSYSDSLVMGFGQALSLFPAISRSGTTFVVGLFKGLDEKVALKFTFLMAIPSLFGAFIVGILKAPENAFSNFSSAFIWAPMISFVVGILTFHLIYSYRLMSKKNLKWFALYVLLLAIGLFVYSVW